jgi:CheY-like chemotaxis protein
MLRFEFEMNGCRVYRAHSGTEAYEIFDSTDIDAVVSDIRMAGGNGIQLLERIRERQDRMQPLIIFITAYDTALTTREAYGSGAEGFFTKPFRLKDLVRRVENLLMPPIMRWGITPKEPAVADIRLQFPHIELARSAKQCDVGRGGVALAMPDSNLTPGSCVAYSVSFACCPVPHLLGMGVVAWTSAGTSGASSSVGIEFTYLHEGCRGAWLDWIGGDYRRPFIPRL